MKVFVAAPHQPHTAIPGELVQPGFVCSRDRLNPDMPCGCGRVMFGLVSGASTAAFTVAELDITLDDYAAALAGFDPRGYPRDWTAEEIRDNAIDLAAWAMPFNVGAPLERRCDTFRESGRV